MQRLESWSSHPEVTVVLPLVLVGLLLAAAAPAAAAGYAVRPRLRGRAGGRRHPARRSSPPTWASAATASPRWGTSRGRAAKRRIDARGLVVSPGFIDMLGWSEYNVLVDNRAASKITQGITTEITGEGHSIAPQNAAMIAADREVFEYYGVTPELDDARRLLRGAREEARHHQHRHLRGRGRRARVRDGPRQPAAHPRRDGADGGAGRAGHGGGRLRPLHLAALRARPLRLDERDHRPGPGGAPLRRHVHHPPARRGQPIRGAWTRSSASPARRASRPRSTT